MNSGNFDKPDLMLSDLDRKIQAEKWKSQIDERAYKALMNYEVNIDD